MNNTSTDRLLIKLVSEYADIAEHEMQETKIRLSGCEYELAFHTDYMSYFCYVNMGCEVVGFLSEPVPMSCSEVTDLFGDGMCA